MTTLLILATVYHDATRLTRNRKRFFILCLFVFASLC